MMARDEATAKLLFVRDGRLLVQNFSHLRFYRADGTVYGVERFKGWVQLATGEEEARTLDVLLTKRDESKLVKKEPLGFFTKPTRRELVMVGLGFCVFALLDLFLRFGG
jgi:hypothetical protein